MAIEKNKRKRKFKSESIEIPIKKARSEIASDIMEKSSEEPPEDTTNDSSLDLEENISFSKDFKMLNFRLKLRSQNFIKELRHFLHLTDIKPAIIGKYIEKRGKPLELAEAFERIDKTNIVHVSYLCQALHLVVMEILTNQKTHLESAVHACRYFLKSHGTVIENLINSNNLSHRKCALKLLTAIVCTEPELGRQLLSSFDILSNVKAVEKLLSHSKYELKEIETLRKCYIHFILSYLIDGNTMLIRNILDKNVLVKAVASGLIFDDHVTVCVVLSTLKKYVLKCPEISKTKKVHVFDEECVKSFARLYDWLGPKALAAKFANGKEQKGTTDLTFDKLREFSDPTEKQAVAKAAHEFLLILLTSKKHGITFDAMLHYQQRHNKLQGKIIGFLERPWLCEKKTDLILQVLRVCPDLARKTVRHFGAQVNPLRTGAQFWVALCEMIIKIINELHPRLLKGALDKITLTDFSYWIKDICMPIEVLTHLTGSRALRNQNFEHRLAANRLLLAMFQQYSNYMVAIIEREQQRKNNLRRFKFDLLNHIFANFPPVEHILASLYDTIAEKEKDGVDVLKHLEVTLDLILIICQQNKSFVNKTATVMDYLNLLRPLYASENGDGNIKLELKAIKTILLLYPKALEPHEELFGNVIKSFINAFVHGDDEIRTEAGELLRGIFINTGIFDNADMEIDLWLEALRFVDSGTLNIVATVFVEVFKISKVDIAATSVENQTNLNNKHLVKLFENIEKGLTVQSYAETLIMSKLYPLIIKGVEVDEKLSLYLKLVKLLIDNYLDGSKSDKKFKSISSKKEAHLLPNLIEVNNCILNGELKFDELFYRPNGSTKICLLVLIDGSEVQLDYLFRNERLIVIYIQHILSIVWQMVDSDTFTAERSEAASNFMINFLQILQALSGSDKKTNFSSLDDDKVELSYLEKSLKYIFHTRLGTIQIENIFDVNSNSLNYLNFLQKITDCVNKFKIKKFTDFKTNFREKMVKSLQLAVAEKNIFKIHSEDLQPVIYLMETCQLSSENCLDILECISKLSYDCFINTKGKKTILFDILILIFKRISELGQSLKWEKIIINLSQLYVDLSTNVETNANMEQLENAFCNALIVCHQCIPKLSPILFSAVFSNRKVTKSTVRLTCLLLERNKNLMNEFLKVLPSNISKKELIYPLLNVGISYEIQLESSLLNLIYHEFKNGFMKTIEKPQKAGVIYKENVGITAYLIQKCMPNSECVDFCNKNIKFDSAEIFQVKIIHAIFHKALISIEGSENSEVYSKIIVNFANICIQLLTIVLKKDCLDEEKLNVISFYLFTWLKTTDQKVDFGKMLKSQHWTNFCKVALKSGMYINESGEDQSDIDLINGKLLKLLAFVFDKVYVENDKSQEVKTIFDMIFTHSKFYDIVLKVQPTSVKTHTMHLLYVLAKKCPSSLDVKQIPVILAAYQAKLSDCDRYILALLQFYEEKNIGLHKYRPLIWGEAAAEAYSFRENQEERANLQRQETSVAQVMSLIDPQISEYTLDNFPVWRNLDPKSQIPKVVFEDPGSNLWASFKSNSIEKRIEQGEYDFEEAELRLCPKKDNLYDECYDPAFIVPLMSTCFAPEIYTHPYRPVKNGLLSIVFAALSSQDKNMRMAAGCVHLRYRKHFENGKFLERPFWIQAYDNIQNGLEALRNDWLKHKKNGGIPRIPYISGLFLAKTISLTTDPTNIFYKQLTMFLRLKDTFNFLSVPEFNVLFHSPEIEHHTFRKFIIEIIRNGVKSSSDLFILITTSTFKAIMGFYGSTMSTLEINLLILSVLSTCVKIPGSSKIMVEHVGIIPWLNGVVTGIEFYHFDVIEGIISIINNLWYAVKANFKNFHNFQHIESDINRLVLRLLPILSGRISMKGFSKLLNILNKTSGEHNCYQNISEPHLDKLIGCAQKIYGEELFHCVIGIKENGAAGAETQESFCRSLLAAKMEKSTVEAVYSLKEFVLKWSRSKCFFENMS